MFVGTYSGGVAGFRVVDGEVAQLERVFGSAAHSASVRCLGAVSEASAGGRCTYLASGGADEVVHVYDVTQQRHVGALAYHEGSITALAFGQLEGRLYLLSAAAGKSAEVAVWRSGSGASRQPWQMVAVLRGHKGTVHSIAVAPNGALALSVGDDNTLRLWDMRAALDVSGPHRCRLRVRLAEAAAAVRWSPGGGRYLVAAGDYVELYQLTGAGATDAVRVPVGSPVASAEFVGEEEEEGQACRVLVACADGYVALVTVQGGKHSVERVQVFSGEHRGARRLRGVGCVGEADGRLWAAGATANQLHLVAFPVGEGGGTGGVQSLVTGHRVTCCVVVR